MRLLGPAVERMPDFAFGLLLRAFVRRGHDDPQRGSESAELHWQPYADHGGAEAFVRQIRALHTGDTLAVTEDLPRLGVPARIVWGTADSFQTIEYGERLSRDLRTSLVRIEGARHFVPEDHPDAVAESVNELLEERARAAEAGPEAAAASEEPPPPAPEAPPPPDGSDARARRGTPDWERREQERVPPPGTARGETDPVLARRPGEHPPPRDPARRRRAPRPADLPPREH